MLILIKKHADRTGSILYQITKDIGCGKRRVTERKAEEEVGEGDLRRAGERGEGEREGRLKRCVCEK